MFSLYERFHKNPKRQRRIITKDDFTFYEFLIQLNRLGLKNKKVLDIGCGTGTIDFYLANKGNKVTGIDISKKAIAACKRDSLDLGVDKTTKFYQLNVERDEIKGAYDVIICIEVIEHLTDDKKFVELVYSLMKRKGILILSTPSRKAPLYRLGFLKSFDKRVGHRRRYYAQGISNLIEKNGFKIKKLVKTEGIIRNALFTFPIGSLFLKIINKLNLGWLIRFIDRVSLDLFGESDYIIIATKQ